jgi:hypothetical protein
MFGELGDLMDNIKIQKNKSTTTATTKNNKK